MAMPGTKEEYVLLENEQRDNEGLNTPIESNLKKRVLASQTCMMVIATGISVGIVACKLKCIILQ